MFRKYYILILSLFLAEEAFAQINLVPNPSFEDLIQCPSTISQLDYTMYWFQPYPDIQESSTDLFSSCCLGSCGFINNSKGSQPPRTGNTYIGSVYYSDGKANAREYIEIKFNDSLVNNRVYCVKFYVSLAEKCKYATSNFGVYFSNDSCLSSNTFFPLPYTPQIINSFNNVITDKDNWILIELAYTAQGGENYITIGGFDSDNSSNIVIIDNSMPPGAYYYIDDVSVIDINTPAYAGVDTTITIGDSVFIGRTPEIGLNEDCIWYVNTTPIDTIAGLWVQPDTTTTYVLEQTICGYTTYDTVTVTVQPTGISPFPSERAGVRIYPNPSNGKLFVKLENDLSSQSTVSIYNMAGKLVYSKNMLITNQIEITPDLKQGVYFIQIIPNNNSIKPFKEKITIINNF